LIFVYFCFKQPPKNPPGRRGVEVAHAQPPMEQERERVNEKQHKKRKNKNGDGAPSLHKVKGKISELFSMENFHAQLFGAFPWGLRFKMRHFVVCPGLPASPSLSLCTTDPAAGTPTSAPNLTKQKFYEFSTKQQSFPVSFGLYTVARPFSFFLLLFYTNFSVAL